MLLKQCREDNEHCKEKKKSLHLCSHSFVLSSYCFSLSVCVCMWSYRHTVCVHGTCMCAFNFTLSLPSYDTKVETESKWREWRCRCSRKVIIRWRLKVVFAKVFEEHVAVSAESICCEVLFRCFVFFLVTVYIVLSPWHYYLPSTRLNLCIDYGMMVV